MFSNTIIVELCLRHIHWLFWERNLLLCGGIPLPQTKSSQCHANCSQAKILRDFVMRRWKFTCCNATIGYARFNRSKRFCFDRCSIILMWFLPVCGWDPLFASVEYHLNSVKYILLFGMVSFMLFWLPFPEASYLPLLLWYMCVKCSFVNSQMFKRLIIVNTHK